MESERSSLNGLVTIRNAKLIRENNNELAGSCFTDAKRKLFIDIKTNNNKKPDHKPTHRIVISIQSVPTPVHANADPNQDIVKFETQLNADDSYSSLSISSVTENRNSSTTDCLDHHNNNTNSVIDTTKKEIKPIEVSPKSSEHSVLDYNSNDTNLYNVSSVDKNCLRGGSSEKEKINPQNVEPLAKWSIKQLIDENKPINRENWKIKKIARRLDRLEVQVLKQEVFLRSMNTKKSSLDEDSCSNMKSTSSSSRPGCSYVEQYSHIPETSAFHKCAEQTSHSQDKLVNDKKLDSEQYGRDFTTYDGITSGGRHQSSSAPYRRSDHPRLAAERVHRIRHKLNPVRDYRLMDTVNYLAQGEFASRDDGIKLTPSREAVLSDIIWEDVCRTHWPSAKLGSHAQSDRSNARYELQRLIDSLLRERVAHVERRRRRHYRVVKLNQRQDVRTVGKTGDIIVASNKNRCDSMLRAHHNSNNTMSPERRLGEDRPRRNPKSDDHLSSPERRKRRQFKEEECVPGPSVVSHYDRGQTFMCNHAKYEDDEDLMNNNPNILLKCKYGPDRNPKLVLKQEKSRRNNRKNPSLERMIVLPTLVVRTPSNLKRQRKFNELYHRALNATDDGQTPSNSRRQCVYNDVYQYALNVSEVARESSQFNDIYLRALNSDGVTSTPSYFNDIYHRALDPDESESQITASILDEQTTFNELYQHALNTDEDATSASEEQTNFNDLYQHVLNTDQGSADTSIKSSDNTTESKNPKKKDMSFNINMTLSSSVENILENKKV